MAWEPQLQRHRMLLRLVKPFTARVWDPHCLSGSTFRLTTSLYTTYYSPELDIASSVQKMILLSTARQYVDYKMLKKASPMLGELLPRMKVCLVRSTDGFAGFETGASQSCQLNIWLRFAHAQHGWYSAPNAEKSSLQAVRAFCDLLEFELTKARCSEVHGAQQRESHCTLRGGSHLHAAATGGYLEGSPALGAAAAACSQLMCRWCVMVLISRSTTPCSWQLRREQEDVTSILPADTLPLPQCMS